ncbi:DEAD/DEAH box helicase [Paramicrobacterium humi]|uniref:DEAD/DEAH box helicase n=1 Tax=Paramicrobacterium humi TaxID=640635 RepID=UPI001FE19C1D|nr:DEAD/DEAH box helicase [Microbacterium humi]
MSAEPLPAIDLGAVEAYVGAATYERAARYAAGGAVSELRWNSAARTLSAHVLGNSAAPYRCRVDLKPAREGLRPSFTACSCPVQARCKHVAAALISCDAASRTRPAPEPDAPAWKTAIAALAPEPQPTGERSALALGFELRRARPSARMGGGAAATPADLADAPAVRLGIRPLMRGKKDNWIKGSITWRTLSHQINRLSLEPGQLLWFTQLLGLHDATRERYLTGEADTLALDGFRSPLLWTLLREAEQRGVALVGINRGMSVELAGSASVRLDAHAEGRDLTLAPIVSIDGMSVDAARTAPIGEHGVYSYSLDHGIRLTLAPGEEPLTGERRRLLEHPEPLRVPADDVPEFLRDYYPRLRSALTVESADGSVDLPEVAPPTLVAHVRFGRRTQLSVRHEWEYHDPNRRVPFEARPGERRDADAEREVRARLRELWPDAPEADALELRDVDAAEFTEHVLPALEAAEGVRVEVTGSRPEYRELTESPHVTITTVESEHNDWFNLGFIITIEGREIPFVDLFTALARGKKKLMLIDRSYFSLDHPAFDRLRELLDEADALEEWEPDQPRLSRYQASLWAEFEDLADETVEAVGWRESVSALAGLTQIEPVAPPASVRATLRPYQQEGFTWLAFLWRHGLGGILADDMGLGKTLQTLTLIAHAHESGQRHPFLVVAPTSVVSTWQSEAERFTPQLRTRVVAETAGKRGSTLADAVAGADIVITSYAVMRLDAADYRAQEWGGLILDEAQFVKNRASKAHKAAKDIPAPFRLAITGTPLENSLMDLWSLCSLTAPGLFPSARRFTEEYVKPIEHGTAPERIERLRKRVRPFMMRRTKELVATELPPKQEQVLHVELAPAHRELYDAVLQRERKKLLGLIENLDRNRFIVFRSLTLLRMLALDPSLVDPANVGVPASKLDVLFEQLDDVIAEGHRTLVFSQFTSFLRKAAERLDASGIRYSYLDGSTTRRGEVIEGFRSGDAPVFLISLKAGGFGLTLTEADYVFMLDPWWNPATEEQAIDRTHRIGQTKNVMVYRLVADGTIEEKVMELKRKKSSLFQAVMDDDSAFSQALSADDIRGLLEG